MSTVPRETHIHPTFLRKFWEKVQRGDADQCWSWKGYVGPSGHGCTSYKAMPTYASRKAWILTHGPIHGDECVLHRCDNALCCNPAHLYLGTRADNMIDRFGKDSSENRRARGRPSVLTGDQLEQLWQMRRNGVLLSACAKHFGVHLATVGRYITAVRKQKLESFRNRHLV